MLMAPRGQFTSADHEFFDRLFKAAGWQRPSVIVYSRHENLKSAADKVPPGGFFLLKKRYETFFRFTYSQWLKMDLKWRDFDVYRRPDESALAPLDVFFREPAMATKDYVNVIRFLTSYRFEIESQESTRRALVMGFHGWDEIPLMDFLGFGGYEPYGISHFIFPPSEYPFVLGEYAQMPFGEGQFSLVVAPDLHSWHITGADVWIINDFGVAMELARIIVPGGYFLCDMSRLHGFAMHLVHVGFSRLDDRFGRVELWQKDFAKPAGYTDDEDDGSETVSQYLKRTKGLGLPIIQAAA